jgi:hypothetical protein
MAWSSDPVLIGVAHTYFKESALIAAAKLPAIVAMKSA